MRFIPTRIHGLLDYGMAIVLIISPWIFRFSDRGPKMWVPIALGIAAIAYSQLTSYELWASSI
ncbi:MAG: SPW repeat protein [Thermomicrobiales bacterium]